MKLLVDMNLSPAWVPVLQAAGWGAIHWSTIGAATATDAYIMTWARSNDCAVLTNDLDFSAILATTRSAGPSVVQIRGQDLSPTALRSTLLGSLAAHAEALRAGAILTVDLRTARVRTLPLP